MAVVETDLAGSFQVRNHLLDMRAIALGCDLHFFDRERREM
jgi:hypothetical protein